MRCYVQFIFTLSAILLLGCADYSKVAVENIESIEIEPDNFGIINHGFSFEVEVYALLKNQNVENITRHPDLIIESTAIRQISGNKFQLTERPTSFNDTSYIVNLSLTDETASITSIDSLHLKYKWGICINSSTLNGQNGRTQRKGGVTLFNRNGVHGKNGHDGKAGQNGANYTAYLWNIQDEVRIRIENDSTGVVWKYKSYDCDTIIIDLSGGNGGNGSAGGEGGNGKNGKNTKLPGNGGDGGNGGNGGTGGDGGSILIFVHSESKYIIPKIKIIKSGGTAGNAGEAGIGGITGKALKGQTEGTTGEIGSPGLEGRQGENGPKPVISIINFDYKELN